MEHVQNFIKEMRMEVKILRSGQGMQESHQNLRSEKMKGKLDENSQYDHQRSQIPTQPLMSPKNLCSIDNSITSFSEDHNDIESDVPSNDYGSRGRENMNSLSKLRSGKNLSNHYESKIDIDHKKGVEDDLEFKKALESKKELNGALLNTKDYTPPTHSEVP